MRQAQNEFLEFFSILMNSSVMNFHLLWTQLHFTITKLVCKELVNVILPVLKSEKQHEITQVHVQWIPTYV